MDFGQVYAQFIQPNLGELIAAGIIIGFIIVTVKLINRSRERQAVRATLRSDDRIASVRAEARQRLERERDLKESEEKRLEAIRRKEVLKKQREEEIQRQEEERQRKEQQEMDSLLADWNHKMSQEEKEEVVHETHKEKTKEAEESERIAAVDRSLAEWELDEMNGGSQRQLHRPAAGRRQVKSTDRTVIENKKKVLANLEAVQREADDLDYVIHKLQTGVDFLPIQVQDTITKWKKGEIYQRNTLADLKLKFRYQAYSIDDGLELLYIYSEWIQKQRQQLFKFIRVFGMKADPEHDNILDLVEAAEENQWSRSLEIDMDIIESLKVIREIHQITVSMETRLMELQQICRKRSDQIIAPQWEPKGTL